MTEPMTQYDEDLTRCIALLINVTRETLGEFKAVTVEEAMISIAADIMLKTGMTVAEAADRLEECATGLRRGRLIIRRIDTSEPS